MTDTESGTESGTGTGAGAGTRASGRRRTAKGEALLRDVAALAEQRGFGEAHFHQALGGGDVGCVGFGAGAVLLIPGIGILIGPYGPAATSVAVALLVLAVLLPVAALRYETHRDGRIPRLHVYDGGIVLTGAAGATAHAWRDLRLTEHSHTATYGQGGAQRRVERLELRDTDDRVLCSTGALDQKVVILRLAEAGGARLP
ncbi:hypothetical protein ABZ901_00515 [Actinacidiphila alni]|uniref:hypothetical protein n=1 Tax=Actinacidiphila alni TaxID=380248 RepID=UPI0033E7CF0E